MPLGALFATGLGSSDWAVVGACIALAAAAVVFVFFIQVSPTDVSPHRSKLDQLLERRDAIYDNLRDLRFEFRAGKYSEADFDTMKNSLEMEAAVVLTEIDQLTDAETRRARTSRASSAQGGGQ